MSADEGTDVDPGSSPASPGPPQSLFVAADALPWRRSPHAGVEWKKLHYDAASGASAVLLRFEPGASYGAHGHPAGEQYWVLEGSIEEGSRSYEAGTYIYHPPGSRHRPRSAAGCLLLVLLPKPIEPLGSADVEPNCGRVS